MATVTAIHYRGRAFTLQRVRLADKSGHLWLWSEVGTWAHETAGSRDAALLAIGAACGEGSITDPPKPTSDSPTFASPFDQEGAK